MFRIKRPMESLKIARLEVSRRTGLILAGILVLLVFAATLLFSKWPFSEASVIRDLQQGTSAAVSIGSFHTTWFPHPGCVADAVTLRDPKTGDEIGTIQRMEIVGSYSGLIGKTKHLLSFQAYEVVINATQNELPFHRTGENSKPIELDRFTLHDAKLEVKRDSAEKLTFTVPQLEIRGLGAPRPGSFSVNVSVPLPQLEVEATGTFGPLVHGNLNGTPVSGEFKVNRGSLARFDALRGELTSNGRFNGTFGAVTLEGQASSPDFALSKVEHPLEVSAQFRADVTPSTGEVRFQSINAELGKTRIRGSGVISPINQDAPGFLNLLFDSRSGAVNDLLWLFSKAPEPAMRGPIRFHTTAALAHKPKHFLQEIMLKGSFVIENARFSSPATQTKLEQLSNRAKGHPDDPPTYTPISLLSGDVDLHDGVANLSNVRFQIEGANADGGGTFDVADKKVNLDGKLRMKAELSDATKGFKSKLLKLIDPFYKKHGAGADVPVSITGTASHPKFAVHIMKK